MRKNTQSIIANLEDDSPNLINSFLQLYKESSHNQYRSAITDIIELSKKNNIRKLTFDDYLPIYRKYDSNQKKTSRDIYKETFYKYLYANDLIASEGFKEIWIKKECEKQFLKKEEENRLGEVNENKGLSLIEILKIQELLEGDISKFNVLRMALVWYLLFETDCSVSEILSLTSDSFKEGKIKTNKKKVYSIPNRYWSVFTSLSEKQNNGFSSVNDIVDKLGELSGVKELKPMRIKASRKANSIICSNCNNTYSNIVENWKSVKGYVICTKCSDSLKKNYNLSSKEIVNEKVVLVSLEEMLQKSSVLYTFEELKAQIPLEIDYLKLHEFQIQIGKLGEAYVFKKELEKLAGSEYQALVDESKALDPKNGYDILSYERDGTKIYIEVKTSISEESEFYITNHELETAEKYISKNEVYLIYRVHNILSASSEIKVEIIRNITTSTEYRLEAYQYKVYKNADLNAILK